MTIDNSLTRQPEAEVEPCWRVIGVNGDRSCGKLDEFVHCHNCPVFADAGQALLDRVPHFDDLAEQTAQLALEVEHQAATAMAVVVFRVAEEWLALNVDVAVEVATPRRVHRIPYRSNPVFQGIVNLRGELQLCASLRAMLGIEPADATGTGSSRSEAADPKQRLLVCQRDGNRWAVAVDEVAGVSRVRLDQLGNVPPTIARGAQRLTSSIFTWNGHRVGCLDGDRLFASLQESIG